MSETTIPNPSTLYGLSKLFCERLIKAHFADRRVGTTMLRVGHTYGPGEESFRKLIPETIRRALGGLPVQQIGSGSDLRSFIYIDDVVRAIVESIARNNLPEIINLLGDKPASVAFVLRQIVQATQSEAGLVSAESVGSQRDAAFDAALLRAHLLSDQTSLEDGIKKEVEYMRSLNES